jgi:hypothetical protein
MRLIKYNMFYFYALIIIIFVIIFIIINNRINNRKIKETFIHKIKSFYRPHVRRIRQHYETFINNYNLDTIMHKLKRMNIY